ncbi:MAG: hypothetical protein HQL90_02960 [Magnetococcales bacterium]|nr:hypothetical protein [Magnetococcales bacterium]
MNLSGQQQPSFVQQEGAGFSSVPLGEGLHNADDAFDLGEMAEQSQPLTTAQPDDTLAQLEARLSGLTRMIASLSSKNSELRRMMADRDEYIELMEQENAMLTQQVAQFMAAQGQVIDTLDQILSRFPGGDLAVEESEPVDFEDISLLEETVGNA